MVFTYKNVCEVRIPLAGTELAVDILFSARGSYMRGGYAPWPLFDCSWETENGRIMVGHNKTNQITCPVGQINLDTTPFSDISCLRHYRISLRREGQGRAAGDTAELLLSIDDVPVWKNSFPVEHAPGAVPSGGGGPAFVFRPSPGSESPRAAFGYLAIIPQFSPDDVAAIAGRSAGEHLREADLDPDDFPAVDEAFFTVEALPPPPDSESYPGDPYPFHMFPDGQRGLNPDSLPFSKSPVRKPRRPSAGTALPPFPRLPEDFAVPGLGATVFSVAPARCGDGARTRRGAAGMPGAAAGRVFSSIREAIEALPEDGGTLLIEPGIYTEPLLIEKNVALIGRDPFTTVITGYRAESNGIRRNVLVQAAGRPERAAENAFYAENIAFYNRGAEWNAHIGHDERRGAAFGTEAVCRGMAKNCVFLGRQDTLYLKNGIMAFEGCYIEGDVDFICGGASVLFRDCHIHCLRYPGGYIAAAAPVNECIGPDHPRYAELKRAAEAEDFPGLRGFTFYRCLLSMDAEQREGLHLGRGPWVNGSGLPDNEKSCVRSAIAFIECDIGTAGEAFRLDEQGPWASMDKSWKTELYRECRNRENGLSAPRNAERPQLGDRF